MSTQAGTGVSHHRNPHLAAQEAVSQALSRGAIEKPDFVFMFATVGYDQPTIVRAVREAAGGAPLSGCSGEGIIVEDQPDESNFAVAVMALRSDEIRFQHGIATGLRTDSIGVGRAIGQAIQPFLSSETRALFLFPDGLTINFDGLSAGLEAELKLAQMLPLVGGTAGDNWQFKQTYQYCDDEVVTDGVAWALLAGQVRIASAVNHGCVAIGVEHKVTRSMGNTIFEIDGKPSLQVLKEYLTEEEMADWGKAVVNLPLGFEAPKDMNGYDQYLIRAMLVRDDAVGSVTIPTEVSAGTSIWMTRRDYEKVVSGADRLARQIKEQLGDQPAKMIFQFECAGRGKAFLRDQLKLQLLHHLQQQLPAASWFGFYSFGEIGPVEARNCFHNYTAVLAALY